jgi:2-aminoadipate transaminase
MIDDFAERMNTLRASDVREILKITQSPEVISFAGGLPAPEFFPAGRLAELSREVLLRHGARVLQYSTTEGHPRLREQIASRMNTIWGTSLSADEILITTGSQQGLDLIGKVFLDNGDAVVCESPTYLGAVMAFNVFLPRWIEIPTSDEGMEMSILEEVLRRGPAPKFLYAVLNFQNPSGRTWSSERRHELMALSVRHGLPVIEDNPYGELRFAGSHIPSLQSFPESDRVISLGTFSKVFCPGLRIGWIAARKPLLDKLIIVKQSADLHSSTLDQMITSEYIDRYDLDADIAVILEAYRSRRSVMIESLEHELPDGVSFSRPDGGLFLWVTLPEHLDARELLRICLERNVAFVPGGSFFPARNRHNTLRLNFSNMPEDRIREGIRRLGEGVKQMMRMSVPATAG